MHRNSGYKANDAIGFFDKNCISFCLFESEDEYHSNTA